MFEHSEMQESLEQRFIITDTEPEIFEHLLTFIHTDTVENLKEEQAENLLAVADKFDLENLKLICMQEICKSVKNIGEAFHVLEIAERNNVSGFRDIVLKCAENNAKRS